MIFTDDFPSKTKLNASKREQTSKKEEIFTVRTNKELFWQFLDVRWILNAGTASSLKWLHSVIKRVFFFTYEAQREDWRQREVVSEIIPISSYRQNEQRTLCDPLCHKGEGEIKGGEEAYEADKPTDLVREVRKKRVTHRREQADLFVSFLFPRLDWKRLHFTFKLVHLHVQHVYRVLKTNKKDQKWTKEPCDLKLFDYKCICSTRGCG